MYPSAARCQLPTLARVFAKRALTSGPTATLLLRQRQHHHQHRAVAVDMDDVGLRRIAVADGGDVAHIDHRAVDGLDRQVAELLDLDLAECVFEN